MQLNSTQRQVELCCSKQGCMSKLQSFGRWISWGNSCGLSTVWTSTALVICVHL